MRRKNIPLNVYVDKNTIVHRLSPSVKLAIIIVFILVTSIFIKTIPWALAAVVVGAIPYALAQVPPSIIASQLTPPLFILVPLAAFQWWSRDFEYAAVMFLTIFAAMEVAFLLTLTSTVDEIMESMERTLAPLARFGLPVETISLAMSLTIRLIPLMFETVGEVLDARKARGANMSVMAFATPVVIRSIRRAQAMGEALAARGVGD
ncbi:energy-coupling factor transporter transmembrane component T family protein [Corynebacterium confusum]|uniref:energy-coupling factor transporter transmembrane component T family protein n=1 Tax=Corynebacterium confusum TaxID=71254 RepID=UPI0025B3D4E9|nr:energy-coupling factor transporter transmembrane protein EcfT [Corynebacterium confusum]WJY89936.1 Energy-coupling factor transporter transmembrane protein BioN [Corynebacterium confusum]